MDNLGLTEAWLRERCPDLIIVSMAGFGKTGPEARSLGYGPIIEQMSGLVSLTGYGDGTPFKTGISYGDPIAGIAAAGAAVTSLIHRRRTGRGCTIDLAQREIVTSLIGEAFALWSMNKQLPSHVGNRHEWMAPHNVYACQGEDQWVAIAVANDAQWNGLCAAMRSPDWAEDAAYADQLRRWQNRDALDARIGAWTGERSKQEVFAACRAQGVACGPVWNMTELVADEHLNARGYYEPTHRSGPRRLDGARLGLALDGLGALHPGRGPQVRAAQPRDPDRPAGGGRGGTVATGGGRHHRRRPRRSTRCQDLVSGGIASSSSACSRGAGSGSGRGGRFGWGWGMPGQQDQRRAEEHQANEDGEHEVEGAAGVEDQARGDGSGGVEAPLHGRGHAADGADGPAPEVVGEDDLVERQHGAEQEPMPDGEDEGHHRRYRE